MKQSGLSEMYYNACERMHRYVAAYYDESMHNESGEPISNIDDINKGVSELRQAMNIEIDLIREVSKEYNEQL